ncbi:polysaccharide lyase family 7 protein [Reichenbachiella agariperforans]|uniref:polysaccharide lyase family 7 protein n=1 Tax=Reichenbachiella agariperforans TaxID=156994 RepID=UPI001C0A5A3B|nr:polysaccharide lyase family 7 protein [Reichenbachiella agariperforans]MBU2915027.1 polysaccharide lyase family 7 protein [Reichenbachiella agariperforans]
MKQYLLLLAAFAFLFLNTLTGCDEEDKQEQFDDTKQIESFSFEELAPVVTGVITNTDIALTVPYDTDVTALTPTVTHSTLASLSPASETTQDFRLPVDYTVTAEDGSKQVYTATVTKEEPPLDSSNAILNFSFERLAPVVTAYVGEGEIKAWIPDLSAASNLTPTIVISENATISPASGVAQDFSSPITYTVTAEDGSIQTYTTTIAEETEVDLASGPAFTWINWYLSVPIDNGGSATSIYYEDIENNNLSEDAAPFFYPNDDDSYTMYTKFTGATTSGYKEINGSGYCRTELREYWRGNQSTSDNWIMDRKSVHGLASTLSVEFCNGDGQTYVAQIHGRSRTGAPGDPATVKVLWKEGELITEHYVKPTKEGDLWTSKYIRKTSIGQVDNEKFTITLLVKRGVLYYALHCEAKGIDVEYTELYDYATNGYIHDNYFKTGNYFKWNDDKVEDSQVILYSARTAHTE